MLVPYAPRSPISIDKTFEKQFFFFFPLEKHDLSSIVKKRTIFQFFLLLPLESEILPDLSIRFDAAKFSAEPSIHRSSSYRKGKKNRIVYQENEGNIDCFAVISLITNDKKSTESRPLLSRKPIDHPSTSVHSDRVRKREESEEDSLLSSSERRGCSRKKIARSRRVGKGSKGKGRR